MKKTQPIPGLTDRLKSLYAHTGQSPMSNPVFQLGFELSRELEGDELDLPGFEATIRNLERDAFRRRARHLTGLIGPVDPASNRKKIRTLARNSGDGGFRAFANRWSRPLLCCVFTAHPTFLLNPKGYADLAALTADPKRKVSPSALKPNSAPTIEDEHQAAVDAINAASDAQVEMAGLLVDVARKSFPEDWRKFRPAPFNFGTWVGYDMDGRTDIAWSTSIKFRLAEKLNQIKRYAAGLASLAKSDEAIAAVCRKLEQSEAHCQQMLENFSGDLASTEALSDSANALTARSGAKLLSIRPLISKLDKVVANTDDKTAAALIPLVSAMKNQGLGTGTVHFRINSSQLHNAIRRHLGSKESLAVESRSAMASLRRLIASTKAVDVNFANLAIENTTAVRQFLAIAQIIKHIDNDNPVRLLIAECEQPSTVLCALYFAKLFGIEDRIDISPLFETESALEHGGRFLEALFAEPAYQDYVRVRGIVAIQTGFSDAGRFLGQVPAALAIERLQGRMAQSMDKHGLSDVKGLIFNTHGESMGRGAHPGGIGERLTHPMSSWARAQFARRKLDLLQEASFQGGDGYVYFGNPDTALALLTRIMEAQIANISDGENDDPFYSETDVSLDFYRDVRRTQARYFQNKSYNRALMAFGLSLLNETGSRKSRRQSDIATERDLSLRRIRAIPHNSVLQQLGYPVNVIAGIGEAVNEDRERFADLFARSDRATSLMRLVAFSNQRASIKTLGAYGELFNGAFWATRPYRGAEPEVEAACLDLAERLAVDNRAQSFRQLATQLRIDGLMLRRLLDLLPANSLPEADEERRRTLGVLHALRLALMQHIFLKAVQIPPFSRRNDISRDDILDMVFALRIPDAVSLLRDAYPVEAPEIGDFNMDEPAQSARSSAPEYARIRSDYIDVIEDAYRLMLRISTAIANHFGAHG
ncbi:MAG: phosphoenolpyruvate carboxylase [Pseudomonadota bacterium]